MKAGDTLLLSLGLVVHHYSVWFDTLKSHSSVEKNQEKGSGFIGEGESSGSSVVENTWPESYLIPIPEDYLVKKESSTDWWLYQNPKSNNRSTS